MKDNTSNVTLDMSHGGLGSLVRECVRAYLHTGNPSALMNHILAGVDQYRAEVADKIDSVEHRLNAMLRHTVFLSSSQLEEVERVIFDSIRQLETSKEAPYCSNCKALSKAKHDYTPVSLCSDPNCPCE